MTAMPVIQRLTAEEYFAISSEERWTQLIEGEVVVNQPSVRHQVLVQRLLVALTSWASQGTGRGMAFLPLDVVLDEHNVYAPDVLWFTEGRAPSQELARAEELPDLAIEVRSAATWRYDIGVKKATYERRGLPELWLIDGDADTVLVFRRSAPGEQSFDVALELQSGETLTSPLLPGFTLAIDELVAR